MVTRCWKPFDCRRLFGYDGDLEPAVHVQSQVCHIRDQIVKNSRTLFTEHREGMEVDGEDHVEAQQAGDDHAVDLANENVVPGDLQLDEVLPVPHAQVDKVTKSGKPRPHIPVFLFTTVSLHALLSGCTLVI